MISRLALVGLLALGLNANAQISAPVANPTQAINSVVELATSNPALAQKVLSNPVVLQAFGGLTTMGQIPTDPAALRAHLEGLAQNGANADSIVQLGAVVEHVVGVNAGGAIESATATSLGTIIQAGINGAAAGQTAESADSRLNLALTQPNGLDALYLTTMADRFGQPAVASMVAGLEAADAAADAALGRNVNLIHTETLAQCADGFGEVAQWNAIGYGQGMAFVRPLVEAGLSVPEAVVTAGARGLADIQGGQAADFMAQSEQIACLQGGCITNPAVACPN